MKDVELRYVGGHVEVYTEAGGVPVLSGHPAGGDGRAGRCLTHSREYRAAG